MSEILTKPQIKLINAAPNASDKNDYRFLNHCARMSTQTTDKEITNDQVKAFIDHIAYNLGHQSILEHLWKVFAITNQDNTNTNDNIEKLYFAFLDIFNQADILGNVTLADHSLIVSFNPRILYLLHMFLNRQAYISRSWYAAIGVIYKIIDYFGPIISDHVIFPGRFANIKTDDILITKISGLKELNKLSIGSDINRHIFLTFEIIADRATHLEHVRHRYRHVYTAESTRYVNYTKKPLRFLMPSGLSKNDWEYDLLSKSYSEAEKTYSEIIKKSPPQVRKYWGRSALPNATVVRYVHTTNLRQLLTNFIPLRISKSAQPTIQEIAERMRRLAKEIIQQEQS